MNWIRISTQIASDPKIHTLAQDLKTTIPGAVGLVVGVLVKLPTHARNGDLSAITDTTLDQWAGWTGKPKGGFARAFRAGFCDAAGVVSAWEKHNGSAIRESDGNRERQQRHRDKANESRHENALRHALRNGETGRDGTGRDVSAVAVHCDSKKQLHQLPPTRNTRARVTKGPMHIGSVVGSIDAEWAELMRKADGRIA